MNGEEKKYQEEVVSVNKVTKVTAGGRQLRFQAIVVLGDRNGKVGFGVGKSGEVLGAVNKAVTQAKKEVFDIDISLGTIPHPVSARYKASQVLLMPAAPGTGIIAGGVVRKILVLAGYRNILSKIQGSSNKLNNTKATVMALQMLKEVNKQDYRLEVAKQEKINSDLMRKRDDEKREAKKKSDFRSKKGFGGKRRFDRSENQTTEPVAPQADASVVAANTGSTDNIN